MMEYFVQAIKVDEADVWCKRKHYAKRTPIIRYAFGLYVASELVGIVTYGPTPTPAVQQGMCGPEWAENVLELNRLCVETVVKNASSILVSRSLKLLPKPSVVVSYADTSQGHIGYIYQATNFIYTGAVTAHDDEYMLGNRKVHARTLTAQGITAPKQWAKENRIELIKAKPKHRYVYFVGNKKQVRQMKSALRYKIIGEYPKGESKRYDSGGAVPTQLLLV